PALLPTLFGRNAHARIAALDQPGRRFAEAAERPGERRRAEREIVAALASMPRVPGVPGLAVAVDLGPHELLLGGLGQAGGDQLAGQDLAVVRMPVWPLVRRQGFEQALGDDVRDDVQVRLGGVAVDRKSVGYGRR